MKYWIVKKGSKTYTVGDQYDTHDMLGEYLLMRFMHDSELGRFSYRKSGDIERFLSLYHELYKQDYDDAHLSQNSAILALSEDVLSSVVVLYHSEKKELKTAEIEQVKFSIENILRDSLDFEEII